MIHIALAATLTTLLLGCATQNQPPMTDSYIQWSCAHIPGDTLSWCPGVMATLRQSAIDHGCIDPDYTVIKKDCKAPIPRFEPEVVAGYMKWTGSPEGRKYLAENPNAGSIIAAIKMRERCDQGDEISGMRLVCE